jgi:hypothetical protein
MPLEPAAELLAPARRNRFAVGYFESWDVASLEGAIDDAEEPGTEGGRRAEVPEPTERREEGLLDHVIQ